MARLGDVTTAGGPVIQMLLASVLLQSSAVVNTGAQRLNGSEAISWVYHLLVVQPSVNYYSGSFPIKLKFSVTEFLFRL